MLFLAKPLFYALRSSFLFTLKFYDMHFNQNTIYAFFSTDGLTQFHQFLKSEYSEENIEFWVICELYKHLPASLLSEESQKIYKLYLAPHSPREVNLDSETRNRTISGLSNPTNESFVIAQQTIQGLMNKDSYQRFLRSSFYFDLKQLVWDTHSSGDLKRRK
ncbi:unnamed protein product [Trichobilharzia regenti]|nr:unnamed protein product [Trichobilharzia regenti]